MNRKERDALRELEAKATPGPWLADQGIDRDCVIVPHLADEDGERHVACYCEDYEQEDENGYYPADEYNGKLIAAARNALVPLLNYVDALEDVTEKFAEILRSEWLKGFFTYAHVHGITMNADAIKQTEEAWAAYERAERGLPPMPPWKPSRKKAKTKQGGEK